MIPARASAPAAPDVGIDEVVSICRAALQGFQRHAARLRHEIKGVLIDGSKGKYALQLAARLLANPAVRAVFLHDSHKDSEVRPAIEALYPGAVFSDAPRFVEAFGDLDGPCWDIYRTWEGYHDWGPYVRGERRMQSYGPTLTMIVNRPGGFDREPEVVERFGIPPLPRHETPVRRLRRALRSVVPRAAEIPWILPYIASRLSRRP